jgi:hypothetical protein
MYFNLLQKHKKIARLEERKALTEEKYRHVRKKQKQAEKELAVSRQKIIDLSNNKPSTDDQSNVRCSSRDDETLFQTIKKMEIKLGKQDEIIDRLRRRNDHLTQLLREDSLHFSNVKSQTESLIKQLGNHIDQCPECDKINLCQQRVLLVGGMEKMRGLYEETVVRLGGIFRYHSGKCFQSNLNELVRWSDVVLCPVDVNSHDACMKVKRECKATGKRYFMLRKSSVSTVYRTLSSLVPGA